MGPARVRSNLGLVLVAAACMLVPAVASATPIPMVANAVIIDTSPFYSIGPEDSLGIGNFALNSAGFIDIPYAIFDFGAAPAVSSAILHWNFDSLYQSPPASIDLYVGTDADGVIGVNDRFMGTLIDSFLYSGGELRDHDVTAYVNIALMSGRYFAVRLEASLDPRTLSGFSGGQFDVPSLDATVGVTTVPEPASLVLLASGLAAALARRRRE